MIVGAPWAIRVLLEPESIEERLAALREAGLDDFGGLSWLVTELEAHVHDDPNLAEALGQLALAACKGHGLAECEARAAYCLARILAERGQLNDALTLIARAEDRWTAASRPVPALRTNLGRMQILDDLGRHSEAMQVGEYLLERLSRLNGRPDHDDEVLVIEAAAWGNLGVSHSFVGDHEGSMAAYERSRRLYQDLGMTVQVAQQQANVGIEMLALGRAREASDALGAARQTFADAGDAIWAAKCAGHLAEVRHQLGDLVGAIELLEESAPVLEELGARAEETRLRHQLARVYLGAGLYTEAVWAASVAVETAMDMGLAHDAAFARLTLTLAHLGAGDLEDAEREMHRAAAAFLHVGDRQYLARVDLVRADLLARRGQPAEARSVLDRVEDEARSGGWRTTLAWALLARFDAETTDDNAGSIADEVADLASELTLPELTYEVELRRARLERRTGRSGPAIERLGRCLDQLDVVGAALPNIHMAHAYRSDRLAAHDELVSLLVDRAEPGDAILASRTSDRAKAQILNELASGSRRRGGGGGTRGGALTGELDRLRDDLSTTFAAMQAAHDSAALDALRGRARELEVAITTLTVRQVVAQTLVGETLTVGNRPASGHHPTLSYHVIGDEVVAFTACGDRVRVTRLGAVAPAVRRHSAGLAAQWSRFRMGTRLTTRHLDQLNTTTTRILQDLYDLLVRPLRAELDDIVTDAELLIVPHRLTHGVPFHALHDGAQHLVELWAVSLGATSCVAAPVLGHPERDGFVVLAVPDPHAPQIAGEADALRIDVPGAMVVLGDDATFNRLASLPPRTRFVHLACHGMHRHDNPLFSSLRLADRWVTAADVLGLELDGALVSLSACESGRTGLATSEGLGLAWAFLAAGAGGVVVSEWVVDDATSVQMMRDLYRGIGAGRSPSNALRDAQLAALAKLPHPFHWAPFVYVAAPDPIRGQTP